MATRQVLKLDDCGLSVTVEYHRYETNPYRVYRHTYDPVGPDGFPAKHKKLMVKYADLNSVMYYLSEVVRSTPKAIW